MCSRDLRATRVALCTMWDLSLEQGWLDFLPCDCNSWRPWKLTGCLSEPEPQIWSVLLIGEAL